MNVTYYLDGIDIKTYGVHVSASEGLLSQPRAKAVQTLDWKEYNGSVVDLSKRFLEAREITLECFIVATDAIDFINKCNAFQALLLMPFTRRLSVAVDGSEPLVYEVFSEDGIDVKKTWNRTTMVGTFTLKFKEPEPVKKVLKYSRTSAANKTVSITLTSAKLLNIYWGDGSHTFDVSGTAQTITHDYATNGTFYIVVTGNIDEITSLTSTGTLVWNKL